MSGERPRAEGRAALRVVVGVDGGGSRTRAVLVDETGLELGRGEAPGAVVIEHACQEAAEAVAAAVRSAADAAGVRLPADVLWAGLSGAGREGARLEVRALVEAADLAGSVEVGTDVEAAFQDAFPDGPGVMLIAGTGSVAWARDGRGRTGRVGGWGTHLGDGGSGYAIGMDALRRVALAEDGRERPTVLGERILALLGLGNARALVDWVARASKRGVAALAPLVADAADGGDEVAAGVLDRAVTELDAQVAALLEQMGPWSEPPPLALSGGLVGERGPLRGRVLAVLRARAVRVVERDLDPPMGAARLALGMLEVERT